MKAFVTGGTGFVGAHLVRALLERGDEVTCLVRNGAKAAALGWPAGAVRVVAGDLTAGDALRAAMRDADVVFHVAGRISARHLAEYMDTNRDRTGDVLAAAAAHPPARFVYVSSLAVGGPAAPGDPIDERRPPAPVTDYGRSKLAGEVLVRSMGFPWTIVRPPVVYGEWDRETLRLFRMVRLGVAAVIGDGAQELSVIHAADLAAALIAAATSPAAAGRTYYAAHPDRTTSRGLVAAVARAMGRRPLVIGLPAPVARGVLWTIGSLAHLAGRATLLSADKANEFLAPAWTCRSDALTRDTGWRAHTDLETGVRQTAAWYREHGWL